MLVEVGSAVVPADSIPPRRFLHLEAHPARLVRRLGDVATGVQGGDETVPPFGLDGVRVADEGVDEASKAFEVRRGGRSGFDGGCSVGRRRPSVRTGKYEGAGSTKPTDDKPEDRLTIGVKTVLDRLKHVLVRNRSKKVFRLAASALTLNVRLTKIVAHAVRAVSSNDLRHVADEPRRYELAGCEHALVIAHERVEEELYRDETSESRGGGQEWKTEKTRRSEMRSD